MAMKPSLLCFGVWDSDGCSVIRFLHGWYGHVADTSLDVGGGNPLARVTGGGG
jgi:hypothetical protein